MQELNERSLLQTHDLENWPFYKRKWEMKTCVNIRKEDNKKICKNVMCAPYGIVLF